MALAPRIGLTLTVFGNLFYSIGSYAADFNKTHVYNPRWPPHARFHNGQTMSLSVLLATGSIYLAFRSSASLEEKRHDLFMAAVVGSFYCLAGISAILYPGADWADPENLVPVKGGQGYGFVMQIALVWLGYYLAKPELAKSKSR